VRKESVDVDWVWERRSYSHGWNKRGEDDESVQDNLLHGHFGEWGMGRLPSFQEFDGSFP
jgi:hypothetical protein